MNRQTNRWLRTVLTTAALASLFTMAANAQDQLWIRQLGTSVADDALALAPDGAGGAIVAGHTAGGSLGGPSGGTGHAFLARYDRKGEQLWTRQFGGGSTGATALMPDGIGGVMITGSTRTSLGGPRAGSGDIYLARYNSAGNQLWIRQFGSNESELAWALAPDGVGGVVIAGRTHGDLAGPNAGNFDVFLARYDGQGKQLWIRQFGGSKWDEATALATDDAGGVFVAGLTGGSLAGPTAGSRDVFLARYDGDGNRLWLKQFGTNVGDEAWALAPDGKGGVMIAGLTGGSLGGPIVGGPDAFLARYDSTGDQLWITQFGTPGFDVALALAPDGEGGAIVAGGTEYFEIYDVDAFLARYNSTGDQIWIQHFGTSEADWASALSIDGAGGVMVAGSTEGSIGAPNAGERDAFIARFGDLGCYHADCDQSTGVGVLDMLDFLCFQRAFMNGEEFACDCDTSTGTAVCDVFDFLCFQNAFVAGCP